MRIVLIVVVALCLLLLGIMIIFTVGGIYNGAGLVLMKMKVSI